MAEFKLSRFRYKWRGNWTTGTAYNRDDIIRYGGSSWVCIRQHTAGAFASDQIFVQGQNTDPSPAWEKIADGYSWRSLWQASTLYNPGDLLLYGGTVYLVINSHSSTSIFDQTIAQLAIFSETINFRGDWAAATRYGIGDVIRYGGKVYKCVKGHTSGSIEEGVEIGDDDAVEDSTLETWVTYFDNIEWKDNWEHETVYKVNDLVLYSGSIWRCHTAHTSDHLFTDGYWAVYLPGEKFESEWNADTVYAKGSVVRYGGYLYYAFNENQGLRPSSLIEGYDSSDIWQFISKGVNFRNDWSASSDYRTGDVVRRGGNLYVAINDFLSDGSTYDYLDSSNWEIVIPSINWRNFWEQDFTYAVGDIVTYIGTLYKANFAHTSTNENFPGDNGSGFEYWDVVLLAGPNTGMSSKGDLLTYDLSRVPAGDGSTFGSTRVALGTEGTVLTPNSTGSLIYRNYDVDQTTVLHVSLDGVDDFDDPLSGIDPEKPFRTIRFATEKIERDNLLSNYTVDIAPGIYYEVLPIIVPKKTVILGSELRSTTISPNRARSNAQGDTGVIQSVLGRLDDIIQDIITGTEITKTAGNNLTQDVSIIADSSVADDIQTLISAAGAYLDYYVNGTGINPTRLGTNTATTSVATLAGVTNLTNNKEFLMVECARFMTVNSPGTTIEYEQMRLDIGRVIDAFIYDLTYTGNYKTLRSAEYFKNFCLGSITENMFYVRDATGIRNCTLQGLSGTLNPPAAFELYRRPTGGSYVSLDPGWGPNDDRVWISTRSPYVQGVTTIGDNCVGQKVDGALHNGGNKSIVSNDFTQVLSDGIGAWILNNGRVEMVSVFTYYCQIGYFAEQGGVIRATNGNNSYGDYGCIADGVDPTETPATGVVNNRTQQATIAAAFAGESNDEILAVEFDNAGSRYTTATYEIIGSGTGAQALQEEFLDKGVFNVLVLPQSAGPGASSGGGGYSLIGNNAQEGTTTTITLASNDQNEEPQLLGLRVLIISGTGTGQYGYITAYNSTTKVANISKESTDSPGWDHMLKGHPPAEILDTTTRYRIEPRVVFEDPGFFVGQKTIPIAQAYSGITFGNTTANFTNISGSAGEGTVIDDDGLQPVTATWNVSRVGRTYTVTLNNPGAGYEQGQVVVIPGTSVGGIAPDNNIRIAITEVSNDSTNSIVNFSYNGVGRSGAFVATPMNGDRGVYSFNGEDWLTATLPSTGDWRTIINGEGIFVAVKYDSNEAASSINATTWTARTMPSSKLWTAGVYAEGIFVVVARNSNAGAISTNGVTWTATTLPVVGDSSTNEWVDITYGQGKFVAIANSGNVIAVGTRNPNNTISWVGYTPDISDDSTQRNWVSIAYGQGRFVAMSSTGHTAYSWNAADWYFGDMPSQDGSTRMVWKKLTYGNGIFFGVCDTGGQVIGSDPTTGPTTFCAISDDGVNWQGKELATSLSWSAVAFGAADVVTDDSTFSNNTGFFVTVSESTEPYVNRVQTGAKAKGRVTIEAGKITSIKLWDPGSNYAIEPAVSLVDPNNTSNAILESRIDDGVLSQPTFLNRGEGYRTSSTTVTISGDGFADIIPVGKFVYIDGLASLPGPGAQFRFGDNPTVFTVQAIEPETTNSDGTLLARFRITPQLDLNDKLQHDCDVEIRTRYSQCRITGHDFLDIGSGNFEQTNYPELYSGFYNSAPENEVYETDGGRVFYTSTDQSGNFRVGELFAVEQATGIVTISADFFDLQGLTELRLGGIRFGSGVVIREFSTDALFTADSNNVVPTERAIKAYLSNRLSVGGAEVATPSFIAGQILVGPNLINTTTGATISFPSMVSFNAGIDGIMLAEIFYYRSFN